METISESDLLAAIKSRQERISALSEQKIVYAHLREDVSLEPAEELRAQAVEEAEKNLSLIAGSASRFTRIQFEQFIATVDRFIDLADNIVRQSKEAVDQSAPESEAFRQKRNNLLESNRQGLRQALDGEISKMAYLNVLSLRASMDGESIGALRTELSGLIRDARDKGKEIADAASAVRGSVGQLTAAQAVSSFSELAEDHQRREKLFGIFAIASAVVAFVAVGYAIFKSPPTSLPVAVDGGSIDSKVSVAHYALANLLAITATTLLVRILLTRYNLERNLRIVYRHRIAVLTQLDKILVGFDKEQVDARDRLQLELLRYVFTDPETGYLKDSSADVSINPVVNIAEAVTKRVN